MSTRRPPAEEQDGSVVDFVAFRARRAGESPSAPQGDTPTPSARELAEATNHPVVHHPDTETPRLTAVPDPVVSLRAQISAQEHQDPPLPFPGTEPTERREAREAATRLALRLLGARDATRRELQDRLVSKDVDPEIAAAVAEQLIAEGLIDERDIAQRAIQVGVTRRRIGEAQLRHELRRRGIPDDIVAEALRDIPVDSELQAAIEVARRRLRSVHGDARSRRQKVLASLQRKGFPSDLARTAYATALDELSEADPHNGVDN